MIDLDRCSPRLAHLVNNFEQHPFLQQVAAVFRLGECLNLSEVIPAVREQELLGPRMHRQHLGRHRIHHVAVFALRAPAGAAGAEIGERAEVELA